MDDFYDNLKTSSPKMSNSEASSSPDINFVSSLSKSRYGRTRKPKITEDFYDIDIVLESTKGFKRSPRTSQLTKSSKLKQSPKKLHPKFDNNFEHVTGDTFVSESISELGSPEINSKAIHNFFKSESGMSILQNSSTEQQKEDSKNFLNSDLNLESTLDVNQVLKIITTKNMDDVTAEPKATIKPILKTYTNKRKRYNQNSIVESFGLPDTPIFPIKKDKSTEPKRIKNLDVAPPASENEINLVDKKLLDTPWKIASMDAEIPDLDLLIDSTHDDYKEDRGSPIKLLNENPNIFAESSIDLYDTIQNGDKTIFSPLKKSKQNLEPEEESPINSVSTENVTNLDINKNDQNESISDTNKLLPKLKKIVRNKLELALQNKLQEDALKQITMKQSQKSSSRKPKLSLERTKGRAIDNTQKVHIRTTNEVNIKKNKHCIPNVKDLDSKETKCTAVKENINQINSKKVTKKDRQSSLKKGVHQVKSEEIVKKGINWEKSENNKKLKQSSIEKDICQVKNEEIIKKNKHSPNTIGIDQVKSGEIITEEQSSITRDLNQAKTKEIIIEEQSSISKDIDQVESREITKKEDQSSIKTSVNQMKRKDITNKEELPIKRSVDQMKRKEITIQEQSSATKDIDQTKSQGLTKKEEPSSFKKGVDQVTCGETTKKKEQLPIKEGTNRVKNVVKPLPSTKGNDQGKSLEVAKKRERSPIKKGIKQVRIQEVAIKDERLSIRKDKYQLKSVEVAKKRERSPIKKQIDQAKNEAINVKEKQPPIKKGNNRVKCEDIFKKRMRSPFKKSFNQVKNEEVTIKDEPLPIAKGNDEVKCVEVTKKREPSLITKGIEQVKNEEVSIKEEQLSITIDDQVKNEEVTKNKQRPTQVGTTKKRKRLEYKKRSHISPKLELEFENIMPRRGRSATKFVHEKNFKELLLKCFNKSPHKSIKKAQMKIKIKREVLNEDNEFSPTYLRKGRKLKIQNQIKMKEGMLLQIASKFDSYTINAGDLMWAKIGKHPFWPCLVVKEPITREYKKTTNIKSTSVYNMYHVRFFGDKGRRSWVSSLAMFPFTSKFDLKNLFVESKNKLFHVKTSSLARWKLAVMEAELQINCTIQQRFDFFNNMLVIKQIKKVDLSTQIKLEQLDTSIIKTEDDCSQPEKQISSNQSEEKTTEINSKTLGNEKRKKKVNSKNAIESVEATTDEKIITKEGENNTKELSDTFLKNPWKVLNQSLDVTSEYSLSDTDSVSKSNSTTSIPNSFQGQIMRQRQNNLFRKISRDRVCQVCKLPEEVFKCKGPCNGLYHYKCANYEPNEEAPPDSTQELSVAERIDLTMMEVMKHVENYNRTYADSTTDYSSSEESNYNLITEKIVENLEIRHVTADHISFVSNGSSDNVACGTSSMSKKTGTKKPLSKQSTVSNEASDEVKAFLCGYCLTEVEPPCFACGKDISSKNESLRQKCSLYVCGKYYHPKCLKLWPQTQWSIISTEKHKNSDEVLDTFVCPLHVCHTCASDDPHAAVSRCGGNKVVKCLCCPATYHTTNYCIPAGTQILSTSQIICPRHFRHGSTNKLRTKHFKTINTPWCFICSKGGDLICCETCPTSVHTECLNINFMEDDTFICEDCETGRFPLYDEIVWVKLGKYRWWPAVILFPNEVPANVQILPHNGGEFVVKFFGTYDHYWVGRGRVFLFQEGDKGHCSPTRNKIDALFKNSIDEATAAFNIKKVFRKIKVEELKTAVKPPPYIRIKVNKPVGSVRQCDGNISNTTSCECNPLQENPCGPDSDCINRLLSTECNPNVCPAKEKCNNQRFEKRQYPRLVPFKTESRGWGLRNVVPIAKGDFVIEYVGEIIDDQECQRRIRKMHEQKDENYYFLTIDKDHIIDAGPKGNFARFMNHSCQPNCETQKWTINGDTRVGLFAIENIAPYSELTFNYNLECVGKEKKECKCEAPNCSGFIGVKVKDEVQKKTKKSSVIKRKKMPVSQAIKNDGPCFVCGKDGDVGACHNKICTKFYHLKCVNLEVWPEGKWVCPWHNCNICTKRTIRCCVKCTNSYCPVHSESNVRHDKLLGFVCSEHDSTKETQETGPITPIVKKIKRSTVVTNETDVTSTTCDELDPVITCNEAVVETSNLKKSLTSTPVKNSGTEDLVIKLKNNLIKDKLDSPQPSIPKEKQKRSAPAKRRKQRAKKALPLKQLKLSSSLLKSKLNINTSRLVAVPTQNEVKLCSSIPTRHLRTRSGTTKVATKRFLGQQNELEKDLPIRKRTRPRCEVTM